MKALAAAKERKLPMGHIVESCGIGLPTSEELDQLLQTENVPRLWSIRNGLAAVRKSEGYRDDIWQMTSRTDQRINEVIEKMLLRSERSVDFQLQIEDWASSDMKYRVQSWVHGTIRRQMQGASLKKLRWLLSKLPSDWRTQGTENLRSSLNWAIQLRYENDVINPTKSVDVLWGVIDSKDASSTNKTQAFEKIVLLTEGWGALWAVFTRSSTDGQWSFAYTSLWTKLIDCTDDGFVLLNLLERMSGKADSHQQKLISKLFIKIVQVSKLSKIELVSKLCRSIRDAVQNARAKSHWIWFPFASSEEHDKFVELFSEAIQEVTGPEEARKLYELANDLRHWNGNMEQIRSSALKTYFVLSYPVQKIA